jgi:hypothetical protein
MRYKDFCTRYYGRTIHHLPQLTQNLTVSAPSVSHVGVAALPARNRAKRMMLEDNGTDLDSAGARESAQKLFKLVEREGVTLTVFGHDEKQWPTLKKAPEFYN